MCRWGGLADAMMMTVQVRLQILVELPLMFCEMEQRLLLRLIG